MMTGNDIHVENFRLVRFWIAKDQDSFKQKS